MKRLEGDDSKLVVYGLGDYTQIPIFVIPENSSHRSHKIGGFWLYQEKLV
jgi:hypothetical protein